MYAKIEATTWELSRPARSSLKGCDREFEHELGCPAQGSYQDCTCYVSRIRLVKTPVGEFIPTTEPDLSTNVKFWHDDAEKLRRENFVLLISLILSSATAITAMIAVGSLRGWL